MQEIIVKVDGMMCGMCEKHVNECIQEKFQVKKVTSSHDKGETVILTEAELSDESITEAIKETGYQVLGIERKPYEKKGLFSAFRKN